ncbi:MAG: GTPase HflX [Candidatus Limnocylindria bacterium]
MTAPTMPDRPSFIDLTAPEERAFLIGLDDPADGRWPIERSLAELAALAETAGAVVVGSASQRRRHPDPVTYFGKGRAAELVDERAALGFNLLIVDDELAPNQQRALEKLLDCKVLDRSALIIDIFARHASTREGRLQVELAALEYHLPRLTRLWTHLSRTGGGIGTRGPGESQLETDRRLIRDRIKRVRGELEDVKRQRATAARQRERSEVATVALVGYTNAGKSTLLNRLADADLFVADMLFATLDPTSRRVTLPSGQRVVVTDTVGFINKLPHDLVDAFRATLEEVLRADLLIEVVDAADPDFVGQQEAVEAVLGELGAADKPRIVAFNKIDRLAPELRSASMPAGDRAVFISATSGEGIDLLLGRVAAVLRDQMVAVDAVVPWSRGELVARAKVAGDVSERFTDAGVRLSGHLPDAIAAEVQRAAPEARRSASARRSRR